MAELEGPWQWPMAPQPPPHHNFEFFCVICFVAEKSKHPPSPSKNTTTPIG